MKRVRRRTYALFFAAFALVGIAIGVRSAVFEEHDVDYSSSYLPVPGANPCYYGCVSVDTSRVGFGSLAGAK